MRTVAVLSNQKDDIIRRRKNDTFSLFINEDPTGTRRHVRSTKRNKQLQSTMR